MNHLSMSADPTIYSYQLIRKIRHSYVLIIIYWVLLLLFAFSQLLGGDWVSLLAGALGSFVLQSVIARLCLWMMRGGAASVWGWRFSALWNGMLPLGLAPMPLVRRVHSNLLWIGLAAIGLLFPWLPNTVLLDLVFCHLWLLAPRWWILLHFQGKGKSGWVKINPRDTSCYVQ